jgi:hypothetical protein
MLAHKIGQSARKFFHVLNAFPARFRRIPSRLHSLEELSQPFA